MTLLLDTSDRMSVDLSAYIACDVKVRAFREWYEPAEWDVEGEPHWQIVCAVRWNGCEYGVAREEDRFDEHSAVWVLGLAIKADMGLEPA